MRWGWLILLGAAPTLADEPPLSARMHDSWKFATSARDRVIVGDLEGARELGQALAHVGPDAEVPALWRRGAAAVRERAQNLANATDLTQAAVAVGQIGAACGTCHEAAGGPSLQGDALPPYRWIRGEHGPLHAWGAEWMWLGLIAAQDQAWQRGAVSLDEQPLDLRWSAHPPGEAHLSLEQLVYTVMGRAAQVESYEARGEVYGQLLATCDRCHSLPAPAPPAPIPPAPDEAPSAPAPTPADDDPAAEKPPPDAPEPASDDG